MTWSLLIIFLPHQFDNISNRRAHFETTGPEIWQQTEGRVDAVTFSTGTGGTIAGKQQTATPPNNNSVKDNNPFLAEPKIPGIYLFNYSWNSSRQPPWGQKKAVLVERFKQESMYGLRCKKIGRSREVAVSGDLTVSRLYIHPIITIILSPESLSSSQSYLINMTSRIPRDRERDLLTSEGNYQSDTEKTMLCI